MYTIEELKKALENRRECLAYLTDKFGNPKAGVNIEAYNANLVAVWAIEKVLEEYKKERSKTPLE